MKNENQQDRIGEIFAQKLEAASSEKALWSTPSEAIWLGVNAELRKKRRERRLLVLFLFLFGLMIGFFLFGNQVMEWFGWETKKEIPIANIEQQRAKENLLILDSQSSRENEETNQNAVLDNSAMTPTAPPPNVPKQKNLFQGALASSNLLPLNVNETEERLEKQASEITVFETTPPEKEEMFEAQFEPITNLQSDVIALLENDEIVSNFEEKIIKQRGTWIIEASSGLYNSLRRYPISTEELELEITPTSTWTFAANAEKIINKNWSVGTGIGYRAAEFDANYDLNFMYSKAEESRSPDGGFEKAYRHTLPSLLAPLDAEFILVRSTDIAEGEDIPLSLELSHGIQHLNIPLYTKYRIHFKKLFLYAKVGVTGNWLISDLNTNHKGTESHHDAIHSRSSNFDVADGSKAIVKNDFSLSYLSSIGLQVPFSFSFTENTHYLFLEPTFTGEIISTYPDAATGDKIINLGGQIGVGILLE
ncbi:MAG: hypothetical protein AAGG68_12020 [Bacteroidota bacterium]